MLGRRLRPRRGGDGDPARRRRDRARAGAPPALVGGGDCGHRRRGGACQSARFVLLPASSARRPWPDRVARRLAAAPRERLYLVARRRRGHRWSARRHSQPRARARRRRRPPRCAAWQDAPADAAWTVARSPATCCARSTASTRSPTRRHARSWAEWLYFNGRSGDARFYLTFLVGPPRPSGRDARPACGCSSIAAAGMTTLRRQPRRMTDADCWPRAGPHDRTQPRAARGLATDHARSARHGTGAAPTRTGRARGHGEIVARGAAAAGRCRRFEISGARGWLSGLRGAGDVGRARRRPSRRRRRGSRSTAAPAITITTGASGKACRGSGDRCSTAGSPSSTGACFPPPDAADPDRIPGFLAALGPDGPLGYATDVTIDETNDPGTAGPPHRGARPRARPRPRHAADRRGCRRHPSAARSFGADMDFLQLRVRYTVSGKAGDRAIQFEAPGSAETFRGRLVLARLFTKLHVPDKPRKGARPTFSS